MIPSSTAIQSAMRILRTRSQRPNRLEPCSIGPDGSSGRSVAMNQPYQVGTVIHVRPRPPTMRSAAAAGLLIATGIRMLLPHRGRPAALLFAALAFGLMAFGKLPLLFVLLGLAPLSIAVAGIARAR